MKKLLATALLASLALSPLSIYAQLDLSSLPGVQTIGDTISGAKSAIGAAPTVPVKDTGLNAKETGISIFGFNIGVSWNQLAIDAAKIVLNQVINSTIDWANTGFDGNPAFVTDPGAYFGGLANGIAGDFISRTDVGFLCSPLQNDYIRLSLQRVYTQPYQPQCTLTQIGVNLDNFYKQFSTGGWNAFFQITQDSNSNPYGAFINAEIKLDQLTSAAVGAESSKINWGQGFKSQGKCILYNGFPPPKTISINVGGVEAPPPTTYNSAYPPGGCITYGPVQTPGSTIKDHIDRALPANNFISQITTADQFDKLLSALLNGLIQRFATDKDGLLGKASRTSGGNNGGTSNTAPLVSCSADKANASVGDKVNWFASSNFEGASSFTWHGIDEDFLTASGTNMVGNTATIRYAKSGPKTAYVIASTTEYDDLGVYIPSTHKEARYDCNSTVQISNYPPLTVTCTPNTLRAYGWDLSSDQTSWVTWTAIITGGSGKLDRVQWDGDQALFGKTDKTKVWPDGLALDSNDSYSPSLGSWNWALNTPLNISHAFAITDQSTLNVNVPEVITHTKDSTGINKIQVVVKRPYLAPQNTNGISTVSASITVIDSDPTLQPQTNFQCGNSVTITKK